MARYSAQEGGLVKMNKHEIRLHLDRLGRGTREPEHPIFGICAEIEPLVEERTWYKHIRTLMTQHPKASDNKHFPIAHPSMDPQESYWWIFNKDSCDMWDVGAQKNEDDAEYVRRRLRLCRWLSVQLKKEGW